MSCGQLDLTPIASVQATDPWSPELVSQGGPMLWASNAPEQILLTADKPNSNLWKTSLLFGNERRVRCFIWHVNESPYPVELALRADCPAGNCTINNFTLQEFTGVLGDLSDPGMCLSKAQLYNTLNISNPPLELVLNPNSPTVNIRTYSLDTKPAAAALLSLACSILEFDVSGSNLFELRLWTSATTAGTPFAEYSVVLEPAKNPAGKKATHIRGCWTYANLVLEWPVAWDVKIVYPFPPDPTETYRDIEICAGDGPEKTVFSKANSFNSAEAEPNPGAYGANLKYQFHVYNSEQETGFVYASLMARNAGGKYWGAARITLPVAADQRGVSKFPITVEDPPAILRMIDLNSALPSPGNIPIAWAESKIVQIEIANGGGAALPVNFRLGKAIITPIPPGDDTGDGA